MFLFIQVALLWISYNMINWLKLLAYSYFSFYSMKESCCLVNKRKKAPSRHFLYQNMRIFNQVVFLSSASTWVWGEKLCFCFTWKLAVKYRFLLFFPTVNDLHPVLQEVVKKRSKVKEVHEIRCLISCQKYIFQKLVQYSSCPLQFLSVPIEKKSLWFCPYTQPVNLAQDSLTCDKKVNTMLSSKWILCMFLMTCMWENCKGLDEFKQGLPMLM